MAATETLARVGLVTDGDASKSEVAFSGTAKRMFESLVNKGHEVIAVDASIHGLRRGTVAAISFSTNRGTWRSKFRYGTGAAAYRTKSAVESLGTQPVDVLLQIGATFDPPPVANVPYAIYCDWNMALTIAEAKETGGSRGLSVTELETIGREHARRYKGAAAIFTISERLKKSFVDLYGIDPSRVYTAYAGPNFDMSLIEATLQQPKRNTAPTILFIGKEFKRKGGDTVAAAFAKLRETLPAARLMFAGTAALPVEFQSLENVDHLGLLDKADPAQLQRLLTAYRDADILVLPSRHDPFPTVIREAMFFGMPCIGSDIWAMSEMIEDGNTGFLVPVGDPEALAARMKTLLENDTLRAEMGRAARARAEAKFSWESVGNVLSEGVQAMLQKR
jgi:glycosyltransferase involved in cell wall biosynthesis